MIISHAHRFIYMFPPRTASTSVRTLLRRTLPPGQFQELKQAVHARAKRVRQMFPYQWELYGKIAHIRHPYTRCISAFSHWLGLRANQGLRDKVRADSSPHLWAERYTSFLQRDNFAMLFENKDKGFFFLDNAPIEVQLIRYEHLREDLQHMSRRYGLELDLENNLPWYAEHGAKTHQWTARTLMNDNAKALIDERYAWYFERFGYKKEIEDAA